VIWATTDLAPRTVTCVVAITSVSVVVATSRVTTSVATEVSTSETIVTTTMTTTGGVVGRQCMATIAVDKTYFEAE
jgi:hypothetical protein